MAKAIKFNLILDKKAVRGLDDLRDNFNIEDLLGAYRNGSLKRWLESREMTRELGELEKITGDDIHAAQELCRIFHAECSPQQLEAAAYPFDFRQKEAETLNRYENLKAQKNEVIRAYHEGYDTLLKELANKGDDYAFVKPGIAELFRTYAGLYRLDAEAFYTRFIKDHPLVILAMLANEDTRPIIARKQQEIFSDLNITALTQSGSNESATAQTKSNTQSSNAVAFFEKWKKNPNQPGIKTVTDIWENAELLKRNQKILMLVCDKNHSLDGTVLDSGNLSPNYYPCTYIPVADISRAVVSEQTATSSSPADAFFEKWKKNPNQPGIETVTDYNQLEILRKLNQRILMLDCNDNPALVGTVLASGELKAHYYPCTYIPCTYIPSADIPRAVVSKPAATSSSPVEISDRVLSSRHVKTFAGETEGYWKDIQPRGKKFLLIKMESGNVIRNAGKNKEELKAEDVNGKFPILDGIDYKSNNAGHQLVYMEV